MSSHTMESFISFCLILSNFLECVTNVDVLVELTLFIRIVENLWAGSGEEIRWRMIAFYVPFFLVCLLQRLFLLNIVRQNIKLRVALVWPVQQFLRNNMVLCQKCSKIWWDNWNSSWVLPEVGLQLQQGRDRFHTLLGAANSVVQIRDVPQQKS